MSNSIKSLADAEFKALFRDFHTSAFRLETLQKYAVGYEDEPFRHFLAGQPRYTSAEQSRWAGVIRANLAAGKSMSRVHIVVEPISDYVRFELTWPYVDSVEAGEDVRILAVADEDWPAALPHEDFWLFDSTIAAVMRYDDVGHFVDAAIIDDPVRIEQFIDWRSMAMAASVGYRDYIKTLFH